MLVGYENVKLVFGGVLRAGGGGPSGGRVLRSLGEFFERFFGGLNKDSKKKKKKKTKNKMRIVKREIIQESFFSPLECPPKNKK